MQTWLRVCALLLLLYLSEARIWSIALGSDYGGHDYVDKYGNHQGFGIDLVDRVCDEGGMDCRIVVDTFTHCWLANKGTHSSPGVGLLSRKFDACLGWYITVPRIHSLAFSQAYTKRPVSYFWVLKGNSFNPTDLSGKKIAFIEVAAADAKCVARQTGIANNVLEDWQVILTATAATALQDLKDNKADAIFWQENFWTPEQRNQLDKAPRELPCTLDGSALMARKDNGIIAAWNIGFTKLKATNGFAKFCQETVPKHAHQGIVPCKEK